MKRLQSLRQQYEDVEIPIELNSIVQQSIQQVKKERRHNRSMKGLGMALIAALTLFFGSIYMNTSLAQAMSKVPVLGAIVDVLTAQQYSVREDRFQADIWIPTIQGLEHPAFEKALNEQYLAEAKEKYRAFEQQVATMKQSENGYYQLYADFEVITETDQLLVIAHRDVQTMASGFEKVRYDTIDKVNGVVLSLPALFKNDTYISVISSYIKEEMARQMAQDEEIVYFIEEEGQPFQQIDANQSFYINDQHTLVISFDEYEVAPGSMGVVSFEIPTALLSKLLVSDYYIH